MSKLVGILMGSQADWETMIHTSNTLDQLGIEHEASVISAHRAPHRLTEYCESAKERGLKVLICGAGVAAALPGAAAALTPLPVLGVPLYSKATGGMDALLAMAQMPGGVPVGTLAIGRAGAVNAAVLAASILALGHTDIEKALDEFRAQQTQKMLDLPDPREA